MHKQINYNKYIAYRKKYILLGKMKGGNNIFIPKTELLRDHGSDGKFVEWKKQLKIPVKDAFCLKFKTFGKKLYYIASNHTTDETSDTFAYIHQCINKYKPGLIILEGIPISKGINPNLKNVVGEPGYAMKLAIENKIDFIGIEGSEKDIILELAKRFNNDDIYGWFFLRDRKYCHKTLKIGEEEFKHKYWIRSKKYLDEIFEKHNSWNSDKWFSETFKKPFSYYDNDTLEFASPIKNSSIITQQINFENSKIRDWVNIKNLYSLINEHNTIIYIMGQNHAYADFDVILDTFKNYQIVKLIK